jgi:hypothetical protein
MASRSPTPKLQPTPALMRDKEVAPGVPVASRTRPQPSRSQDALMPRTEVARDVPIAPPTRDVEPRERPRLLAADPKENSGKRQRQPRRHRSFHVRSRSRGTWKNGGAKIPAATPNANASVVGLTPLTSKCRGYGKGRASRQKVSEYLVNHAATSSRLPPLLT